MPSTWPDRVVIESLRIPNTNIGARLIETIAERDRKMVRKLDAEWSLGRFQNGKLEPIFELSPADQLVFRMQQAAKFSSDLALDGDRFDRLKNLLVRSE
jgi:hypothetical protein